MDTDGNAGCRNRDVANALVITYNTSKSKTKQFPFNLLHKSSRVWRRASLTVQETLARNGLHSKPSQTPLSCLVSIGLEQHGIKILAVFSRSFFLLRKALQSVIQVYSFNTQAAWFCAQILINVCANSVSLINIINYLVCFEVVQTYLRCKHEGIHIDYGKSYHHKICRFYH